MNAAQRAVAADAESEMRRERIPDVEDRVVENTLFRKKHDKNVGNTSVLLFRVRMHDNLEPTILQFLFGSIFHNAKIFPTA